MSLSTSMQLSTVGADVRWVHQADQAGAQTQPPCHAWAADASPDFIPRPPPSATPQVLDGLLDYQFGMPAPDANTGALACMSSGPVQRPSPSATPLIMAWVQGNLDMAAAPVLPTHVGTWADGPSSSVQRRRPLTTLEIASNSAAQERSAPHDASRGRSTAFMPPPARILRQETGAPDGEAKITDDMLREWVALGRAGIQAAGGLIGLSRKNNVSFAALRNYLRSDGTLRQRGANRLNPGRKTRITDDMLRQRAALDPAEIRAANGIGGLARRNDVSTPAQGNYLRSDRTLIQQGKDRLTPGPNPEEKAEITADMVRQWATLGRAGIKAAGGINGLAGQNNISVGALRNYLRANGTLTQYGEDRLNPEGKVEINNDMLWRWATLGEAGIKAAGGLDALARQSNVSVVALRTYLRADGRLSQRAEDRLNPNWRRAIPLAMLRQWATLGPSGIEAAGGLDGLARQYNVSTGALRTYLHIDGTLTVRGEERLRKAGTLPS
ncbi:hypothetical protein [Pandoraea pulmonicola]|nr:hypothetical protein [Pandoraea pulmonicola]